jgi:hypothetical protein
VSASLKAGAEATAALPSIAIPLRVTVRVIAIASENNELVLEISLMVEMLIETASA